MVYKQKTLLHLDEVKDENQHGKSVIDKLKDDNDFRGFIEKWRMLFLESMNPKFLPDAWFRDGKPVSTKQEFFKQNS